MVQVSLVEQVQSPVETVVFKHDNIVSRRCFICFLLPAERGMTIPWNFRPQLVERHSPGHALELALTKRLEPRLHLAGGMIPDPGGHQNTARLGQSLKTRRNIDDFAE